MTCRCGKTKVKVRGFGVLPEDYCPVCDVQLKVEPKRETRIIGLSLF